MKTVASQAAGDTSGKILQAAKRLFAQYGYHGVSVKQITQEAGANSALVSYHFGGKAQLYQTVLEQQADKLLELVDSLKTPAQSPLKEILVFLDKMALLFLQEPETMHILYREFLMPTQCGNEVVGNRLLLFYERLSDAFQNAKLQQSVKPGTDSRRTAFVIISIFSFYLLTYNYEAISESSRALGKDDFLRLHDVYVDYLQTISTGKESLV